MFEIELSDAADAEARLKAMCEKLLANTVIEDFRVELSRVIPKRSGKAFAD